VVEAREAEDSHLDAERLLGEKTQIHEQRELDLKARLERSAELRARASSGRQRQEASEQEARALAEQIDELRLRRDQLESGAAAAEERARAAAELLTRTEHDLVGRLEQRESMRAEIEERERRVAERQQAVAGLDEDARSSRAEVERLREQTREAEVARARAESAREHLDDLCSQELELTATEALAAAESVEEADLEGLESEIVEIKQKIERIGPVNMTAIEEFSDLEERHAFLTAQRTDLDRSMESLRESIRRINRQSRQRFEEAFEAIRHYYQETYKLLFSGGRADLRLEEGEDVLECGIEILAQPPGKRLTGVHLLSGGEKALSAIALLFAIFRYQPSPFCLLDEVDAALDDANVGRFMRMVGEYAKNTQFVVVTHNKLSMEVANLLYGVTMEERGVSKVVSLQLQ
jgi:chromosome segregation protein